MAGGDPADEGAQLDGLGGPGVFHAGAGGEIIEELAQVVRLVHGLAERVGVGPVGEGGLTAPDGLCSIEPHGRIPLAIIGGTGYVGRLLARRLLSHPTFCLGPIVGSKRSEGMIYQSVWEEKEAALMANYGNQLWNAMAFAVSTSSSSISPSSWSV